MCSASPQSSTLSLHDALPIFPLTAALSLGEREKTRMARMIDQILALGWLQFVAAPHSDRKSTRLNSSHRCISYAVFCLKKKKHTQKHNTPLDIQNCNMN